MESGVAHRSCTHTYIALCTEYIHTCGSGEQTIAFTMEYVLQEDVAYKESGLAAVVEACSLCLFIVVVRAFKTPVRQGRHRLLPPPPSPRTQRQAVTPHIHNTLARVSAVPVGGYIILSVVLCYPSSKAEVSWQGLHLAKAFVGASFVCSFVRREKEERVVIQVHLPPACGHQ